MEIPGIYSSTLKNIQIPQKTKTLLKWDEEPTNNLYITPKSINIANDDITIEDNNSVIGILSISFNIVDNYYSVVYQLYFTASTKQCSYSYNCNIETVTLNLNNDNKSYILQFPNKFYGYTSYILSATLNKKTYRVENISDTVNGANTNNNNMQRNIDNKKNICNYHPKINMTLSTDIRGNNLSEAAFNVYDCKKTEYSKYPQLNKVIKGKGKTLRQKIQSLSKDKNIDNIMLGVSTYGMLKYILSKLLYGCFDIEYLLMSKNEEFMHDLHESKYSSFSIYLSRLSKYSKYYIM